MKKVIALTLMTLGSFLWADAPMPQIDPFELLNSMDPKELDKLMDDLAKMSPEEIKYYEDLGKQMFKDSGYDLDEIAKTFPAQTPPAPTKPVQQPAKQPEQKPAKAKPTVDEPSKKEKDSLLRMVKALSDSLASIRQKAASDETLHPHLAPLQQELDLLTAYVNRLDYERHLKHFADKEFAALKTKLRKMSSMLEEFDNNLFVPQLTLRRSADDKRASGSYGTQMNEAASVIKEFKTYMSRAFGTDTIITDIENLFKKHDQEALVIKKQIEDQQKKASEQVKKLSVTNIPGKFAPIPKVTNQPAKTGHGTGSGSSAYNGGSGSRSGGGYPSSGGNAGQQPQRPGAPQQQQADKGKMGAPKAGQPGEKTKEQKDADAKTRGKKDDDFAEVPLTPQEALAKIQKDLRSVNIEVARNKEALNRIVDAVTAGTKPSLEDHNILKTLTEDLLESKTTLNTYLTNLKKENKDKNPTLITKNKKILKDSFTTDLNELIAMNDKFVALALVPAAGAGALPADTQEAINFAKDLITDFKKQFANIENLINPRTRS